MFEGCEFEHTLTNVAWFRRGCHDVTVRHCLLTDLGGGGVKIGDPAVALAGPQQSDHVSVEDSIIHSGGRYFLGSIGVTIFHASDCTIRHCDIGDFFYTAISIGLGRGATSPPQQDAIWWRSVTCTISGGRC